MDEFLASNPTAERADQAKLFKAEALYKQQNYARAAPIYAELRASQLAPKLRAEAAQTGLVLCAAERHSRNRRSLRLFRAGISR